MQKRYAKIIGTGGYLPEEVFTNADWEKRVDTSHDWIVERTGIKSRHIAAQGEMASDMGVKAAQKALAAAECSPEAIELIIVATGTPDKVFPSTACIIQEKLKIPTCIAFDVQAACTGFIYALSIAEKFIQTGAVKRALVLGTELMSRVIDWSDRNTCVLFGDGAGAVVLGASETPGILSTQLFADGSYGQLLTVDSMQLGNYTTILPALHQTENRNVPIETLYPYVKMDGRKIFKIAVTKLGELVENTLKEQNLQPNQIDWLIPHQANIRIIQAMAEKLSMPMDKVICTIDKHSNTSSASIPLAMDVAIRDGRVKPGQLLLLEAFGGGLTWGSALVRY